MYKPTWRCANIVWWSSEGHHFCIKPHELSPGYSSDDASAPENHKRAAGSNHFENKCFENKLNTAVANKRTRHAHPSLFLVKSTIAKPSAKESSPESLVQLSNAASDGSSDTQLQSEIADAMSDTQKDVASAACLA